MRLNSSNRFRAQIKHKKEREDFELEQAVNLAEKSFLSIKEPKTKITINLEFERLKLKRRKTNEDKARKQYTLSAEARAQETALVEGLRNS